jgi:hypothetical protein
VSEYTNIFYTLRSNIGIKDSVQHLVLKYCSGIHRYIQTKMDFLDISSLGAAYRYAVKIEQKFKQQSKWENHGKGNSNSHNEGNIKEGQPQEIQSHMQTKKGNEKSKKDTEKWCEFHKNPWKNTDECRSIQSLVVEIKVKESNLGMILRMKIYFKMYKPWRILLILHMPTINVLRYFCKNIQISKDFI